MKSNSPDSYILFLAGDRFSEELLEGENNRLVDGMAAKVSSLKHVGSET